MTNPYDLENMPADILELRCDHHCAHSRMHWRVFENEKREYHEEWKLNPHLYSHAQLRAKMEAIKAHKRQAEAHDKHATILGNEIARREGNLC